MCGSVSATLKKSLTNPHAWEMRGVDDAQRTRDFLQGKRKEDPTFASTMAQKQAEIDRVRQESADISAQAEQLRQRRTLIGG